jgi:pyruvate/2-oxoglutarate dehydrogenase complex dihydrolipoamide dehydrogenase (E3) component
VHGRSGEEASVAVRTTSGEQKIEGSDILVAAGRIPNTAGVGFEEAGVELDDHGCDPAWNIDPCRGVIGVQL